MSHLRQISLFTSCLILCFLSLSLFAQQGGVYDSSVIAKKNLPQQQEFWNNISSYPAKPRNQWEVGVSLGNVAITGDVPVLIPTLGFGVNVRKSFGYIFSLRAQYVRGVAKGLMWEAALLNQKNAAWLDNSIPGVSGNLPNGKGYNPAIRNATGQIVAGSATLNGGEAQGVYYNHKTNIQDLSIQGIVTLNGMRFHKNQTKFVFYAGAGIGFTAYKTMVNALDANGNNYTTLFNRVKTIAGGSISYDQRKEIRKQLRDGMDNTYETPAESEAGRRPKLGNNVLLPSGTILAGIAYKLSKRINIALEDRHSFVKSDLLDGQQWQVHSRGDVVLTRDYDSWNYLSLGINVNLGGKAVEPLWWLNPLDYAYSELNNPKHMKLPKPVLDDTDGDGVTDQLDREPNSVAGAPVNTHGVALDTDGDGVPDYKDKQLITPSDCLPVDADGVGKCPAPACCEVIKGEIEKLVDPITDCPSDYPSITLAGFSLNKDNKALLAQVAEMMKAKPNCAVVINGYPAANKRLQAAADKKLNTIKTYLIETLGISADRIETSLIIEGGKQDVFDIKSK
jgi:hypothetical protein